MNQFSCPQRITVAADCPDSWQERWKDTWPSELGVAPVACSYCGCIRPEDAIRIIEAGFEISPSTKSYKWYIEVPGHAKHHKMTISAIQNDQLDSIKDHKLISVGLPIKLYAHHLTPEQISVLNNLWERQCKAPTEEQ